MPPSRSSGSRSRSSGSHFSGSRSSFGSRSSSSHSFGSSSRSSGSLFGSSSSYGSRSSSSRSSSYNSHPAADRSTYSARSGGAHSAGSDRSISANYSGNYNGRGVRSSRPRTSASSSALFSATNGRHDSYSTHTYGTTSRTNKSVVKEVRPTRARTNQPTGYVQKDYPLTMYTCENHDYVYYPREWTDPRRGTTYKAGYYDENGKHYGKVYVKNQENLIDFKCNYCGTNVKLKWEEGAIPSCPNCAALLEEEFKDAIIDTEVVVEKPHRYADSSENESVFASTGFKVGAAVSAIVLAVGGFGLARKNAIENQDTTPVIDYSQVVQEEELTMKSVFGDTLYIESIDRSLTWDDSFQMYYDKTSDCYLVYNMDAIPYVWQYWYEGISSDYDESGWMEYDYEEDAWYIEDDGGAWMKVPEKKAEKLWHVDGTQTLPASVINDDLNSNLALWGEKIQLNGCEEPCVWDYKLGGYISEEKNCFLWYYSYVNPGIWRYWIITDGISDEYGWLEYDETEDAWYYEDQSTWYVLDDLVDTSGWWHVEGAVEPVE